MSDQRWAKDYASELYTEPDENVAAYLPNVEENIRDVLYPYQVIDCAYSAAFMRSEGGAYLGWSRGLGKTLGAITIAQELEADRILVVCPNSSKDSVWRPEIQNWDQRANTQVHTLGGTKQQRERILRWFDQDERAWLLCHYEALRLVDWAAEVGSFDLVIVDEAHRLNKGAPRGKNVPQFYKALKKIPTKKKLALSGSIIVNSPEDFFGANHWLFPKFYRSRWKDWNHRFLEYWPGSYELKGVNPDTVREMQDELGKFMRLRRKKDELPGLPDKIEHTAYVELSPTQRKVYDDFLENMLAQLPTGEIVVTVAIAAQLSKLRQIASGLDLLAENVQDSSKIDLCVEIVEDNLPEKTVVFAWHRATVEAISERLLTRKIPHGKIHGGVKQDIRSEEVDRFQNGDSQVIVATIKTLGESVTLHAAADLVFVESSWTSVDMEQAADRVHRIGQTQRVSVTHIVAKDTVDELQILPTVLEKAGMRANLLGGEL